MQSVIARDVSLARHNTFGLDARARYFATIDSVAK
jgi:hypothetical protein